MSKEKYNYCQYCGKELLTKEYTSGYGFNRENGKPNKFVSIFKVCPDYLIAVIVMGYEEEEFAALCVIANMRLLDTHRANKRLDAGISGLHDCLIATE